MPMQKPMAALLDGGRRLHLHHGPIDLIIGADCDGGVESRETVFTAAAACFENMLGGLMEEISCHRNPLTFATPFPANPTARRMYHAARVFCGGRFLTPMIAVAGAVADSVLAAMRDAAPGHSLTRAYVNNGGDIAVHLADGWAYSVAMVSQAGEDLGRIHFDAASGIGGIATSGAHGRSFSFGIADSVTVLAKDAATADTAASLIANAVDLPGHQGIRRERADALLPDSDLGSRLVVTSAPRLDPGEAMEALSYGRREAEGMMGDGRIIAAALFLQGQAVILGEGFTDHNANHDGGVKCRA